MPFFDLRQLIFIGPGLLLSALAAMWVKSAFARWSQVGTRSGVSGADVAARILQQNGIRDVRIEPVDGFLSDHYDPREKVLRLSSGVYSGKSIASIGVAAHEVGHAVQHARGYAPLRFRSALVPVASVGSNLSWILIMVGLVLGGVTTSVGALAVWSGIILFSGALLFTLVTLPVEFDASARALWTLEEGGYLRNDEMAGARSVLRAAAMTYVAAAITAVLQLLYFLVRSGILGGRSRNSE